MIPAIWRTEAERSTTPNTPERATRPEQGDPAVVRGARRHRRGRGDRRLPDPDRLRVAVGRRPADGDQGARSRRSPVLRGLRARDVRRLPAHALDTRPASRGPGSDLTDDQDPLPLLLAAVRHDPRDPPARDARGGAVAGVPGQRGGPVPEGLDRDRAARQPGAAHHPAGPRPGHRRAPGSEPGTRRSTSWPTGWRRSGATTARTRSPCSVAAGSPTRRPTQLGKFARVVARHQPDRLQRALVHVVGGVAPANQAFGIDRGLPFPLADVEAHRRPRAGRLQPRRDHAAGGPPPRPAPRARRQGRRGRSRGAPPPPSGRTCSSSRCRAPTSPSRSACCTCSTRRARSTRSTSPRARPASTTYGGPWRPGGRSGWSGSPGCRPPNCATSPTCSPTPEG